MIDATSKPRSRGPFESKSSRASFGESNGPRHSFCARFSARLGLAYLHSLRCNMAYAPRGWLPGGRPFTRSR